MEHTAEGKEHQALFQGLQAHVGTMAEPHNGLGLCFTIQQTQILVPDLPLICHMTLGVCVTSLSLSVHLCEMG